METRALLAFVLSVVILVGYQALFAPAPPPPESEAPAAADTPTPVHAPASGVETMSPPPAAAPAAPPQHRRKGSTKTVETDLYRAVFTTAGGRLEHFELKKYKNDAHDGGPLDMVVSDRLLPLGVYWLDDGGQVVGDQDVDYRIDVDRREVGAGETAVVKLTGRTSAGLVIEKALRLESGSYVIDYSVAVGDASTRQVGVAWARSVHEGRGRFSGKEGPVALVADKFHADNAASMKEPVLLDGEIVWGGYADHYFLAAYIPERPIQARFVGAASQGIGESTLWAPAEDGRVHYRLFVGPKRLDVLKSVGHELERAVDFGWFAFVARPLLGLLIFLYSFTGNYGWSIVLLTVGIRIVFYPINKRQAEAMKAMQRIQPELKKLQEKFKDDRERLNREMMELYRRHKVNPLSGCLPMLVQLPVFFGLYRALMEAIELRHAPFVGWITDLSQPDRLGSLAIPFVSPPGIPVLTLLMGASMVVQQRMTPAGGDPMQQRMMMFLPVVFTVMFVNFPSGLVLYWFANNVMSIAQQAATNRSKS